MLALLRSAVRGPLRWVHCVAVPSMPKHRRVSLRRVAYVALLLGGCSQVRPFDNHLFLRQELAQRLDPQLVRSLVIPSELDEAILEELRTRLHPTGGERTRTEEILDFIFGRLDLQYSLTPTRDAVGTYRAATGNCLSFVNLFVGIARHQRLNPFYVEVEDYQRWNYQRGVVLSRGHIVAGMYLDGQLSTFDFLPYRAKSYRDFRPITDVQAMAHYYNNLGAEALLAEDDGEAARLLRVAVALAPDFEKSINNLGVVYLRSGDSTAAIGLYRRILELHPENVPILSNLARAYQMEGELDKADELLNRLEETDQANPFFFLYRGGLALADHDLETALGYMRRAFRADSELPEVHVGLVRVYLALGKLDRARHHVGRALKLDATHEEARKYAEILARP